MVSNVDGYVVYCGSSDRRIPIGVVSDNFECKAVASNIPQRLKDYLVQIEDKRFYEHGGIDYKGILRAFIQNLKAGKIVQGGSSISQQLARNLLRDNRKTLGRKIRETIKALEIESEFSKDEILTLYFNNIYFGKNIRGLRAASFYYYKKDVFNLTHVEQLSLLTLLRGPNYYIKNTKQAQSRFHLINDSLAITSLISKNRHKKNQQGLAPFDENRLELFRTKSIPFITQSANSDSKVIISTIDKQTQDFANTFVRESKYPVSIIAIREGKVIAVSSSYGNDYPFIAKTNVGSTLKPFFYCYLRGKGILRNESFFARKNGLSWKVREIKPFKSTITLEEALFHSNNNAFINACDKVGIKGALSFLAAIFQKNETEFFPSSILGATKKGISLYELAVAYSQFFSNSNLNDTKRECLSILNKIATEKLGYTVENGFIKTGTTNDNEERLAVIKEADTTYAIIRNENPIDDYSKEGNFMNQIADFFSSKFKPKRNYKW